MPSQTAGLPHALLLIVALCVGLLTAAPAQAQTDLLDVGITSLADAPALFASAVEEGDIRRLGSYYDENAILFSPDGSVALGRDNIARLYARNAQLGENRMVFKQVSMESEGTRGSIVWLWDLTISPRGAAPVVVTGRSLLYMAKTAFGWKIVFDMFQLPPAAPAE